MRFNSNILLIIIIILASILRFYGIWDFTYMHDELSAIHRLHFNTLGDLVEYGIKTDGHPLLIQVFLYYWTSLFGYSEWVVKFPFIFCGIASVYLVFLIGKKWFHYSAGLYSAAFLATIQYTVFYSQIARPYASGLFFVLLFAYAWGEVLLFKRNERKIILLYIFSALLCGINHHFSALMALIIGLSGFVYLGRKQVVKFLALNTAVVLLYLPTLPVTLAQMKYGGVGGNDGWLKPPDAYFLADYFMYISQFSFLVIAVVLFGTFYFLVRCYQNYKADIKLQLLLFCWFLLLFATGFFYSVYINPVLQFSVLIFGFPFLILFIFSFWRIFSIGTNGIIILLFCAFNVFNLFCFRQHYKLMKEQPYHQTIAVGKKWSELFPDQNFVILTADNPAYLNFYRQRLKTDFLIIPVLPGKNTYGPVSHVLDSLQPDLVMLSNLPFESMRWLQSEYPYLYKWEQGFNFDAFVLSGKDRIPSDELEIIRTFSLEEPRSYDGKSEWGPGIEFQQEEIEKRDFLVNATLNYSSEPDADIVLVLTAVVNDSVLEWKGVSARDVVYFDEEKELHVSMRMKDILKKNRSGDLKIHSYLWNRNGKKTIINNFFVQVIEDNPYLYGLYERIE